MATTVAQHSIATFTSPINGTTPIDANSVRGNDNTIRSSYNDHDADAGIHLQSSALSARPVAGDAGRKWLTNDTGAVRLYLDTGSAWAEISYLPLAGGTVAGNVSVTGTLAVTGVLTASGGVVGNITGNADTATKLSSSRTFAVTGDVTGSVSSDLTTGASIGTTLASGVVSNTNVSASAAIAYSKLALTGSIVNADVSASAAIADTKLATISTAGKVANSATTAVSTNTANAIVARDASGNFAAGTITAALTGNASTATTLQTARTINGVSFNGSADITVTAAAGTLTGTTLASNVTASSLTSVGTLANLTVTNPITGSVTGSSGSTTGNAATATALQTARNINGVSFNGTADITVAAAAGTLTGTTLASNVTASSLTSVGTLSSLAVSGNLTVDTNTLFVDSTNNRVGLGTASPTERLHVVGNGKFGTGVASNSQTLMVNTPSGTAAGLQLFQDANESWVMSNPASSTALAFSNSGTERMRLDSSGNLGLGVTPSAWASAYSSLDMRGASFFGSTTATEASIAANAFVATGGNYTYKATAASTLYQQVLGEHRWSAAPSGTAGNTISFTRGMTLDASGNVGIGTTTLVERLRLKASNTTGSSIYSYFNCTNEVDADFQVSVTGSASTDKRVSIGPSTGTSMTFVTSGTERARIDVNGNIGLAATPNASWGSNFRAMQYGTWGSVSRHGSNGWMSVANNVYWDNSDVARYTGNFNATWYLQRLDGQHQWYTAPSGTAGNAITFTQAMTLNGQANVNQLALSVNGASIYTNVRVTNSNSTAALSVGVGGSSVSAASLQNNAYIWNTAASALSFGTSDVERARIDASGNLGLGVTPSAWGVFKAFQFGTVGSMSSGSGITTLGHNLYFDGTNFRYLTATNASFNEQTAGQHKWYTAPSGTANNVITFTQAMTLDASGNLGIGAIPSAASIRTLQVSSTSLSSPGTAMYLTANAVFDNPNWKYIGSTFSSQYVQINGGHQWLNAASGTAGANVSFTQAMTLDASGNLGIGSGAATPARRLHVSGSGVATFIRVTDAGANHIIDFGTQSADVAQLAVFNTTLANGSKTLWLTASDHVFNTWNGSAYSTRMTLDSSGNLALASGYMRVAGASAGAASTTTIGNTTATTVGAAGGASALPATPLGYIIAHVGTTQVKIPYYTA